MSHEPLKMVAVVAFAAEATTQLIFGLVKSSFLGSHIAGLKSCASPNGASTYTRFDQRHCCKCSYSDETLLDANKKLAKRKKSSTKERKTTQKAAAAAAAVVEAEASTITGESDQEVLRKSLSALLESAYRQPAYDPKLFSSQAIDEESLTSLEDRSTSLEESLGFLEESSTSGLTSIEESERSLAHMFELHSMKTGMDTAEPLIIRHNKKQRLGLESRRALQKARIESLVKEREEVEAQVSHQETGDGEINIWSMETNVLIKQYSSNGKLLLDWDKLSRERLTAADEVRLARYMVPAQKLQLLKQELSQHVKRKVTDQEWAEAAKITVRSLRRYLLAADAARNKMIKLNLRLVAFQARKYLKDELSLTLLDLCQEGVQGLMRAVDKFDPEKGYRFSTYAVFWVKNSILRAQTKLGHMIRIPYNAATQRMKIQKTRGAMWNELGRKPTHEEIMERLSMDSKRYFQLLDLGAPWKSLNARSKLTGEEFISNLPEPDNDAEYFRGDRLRFGIDDLLDSLTPKENLVIRQRYGLDGKGERSFTEIGRNLNLSREMVRKYEIRGMMKLRHPTRIKYLRDLIF